MRFSVYDFFVAFIAVFSLCICTDGLGFIYGICMNGLVVTYLAVHFFAVIKTRISIWFIVAVCSVFSISLYLGECYLLYSFKMFVYLLFLLSVRAEFEQGVINRDDGAKIKSAYSFFTMSMIVIIIRGLLSGEFVEFSCGVYSDKNYMSIIAFLYFVLSCKVRKLYGFFIFAVYWIFLSNSRSLLAMVLLLILLNFIMNACPRFGNIISRMRPIVVITLMSVLLMYMSSWFIEAHNVQEMSEYKESLLDTSNYMRMVGNARVLEDLKDGLCWFSGYGSAISEEMDVHEDSCNYDHGVRLVQSHNCILNLVQRIGFIPSIVYLIFLFVVIPVEVVAKNLMYIIPWLSNALFMHSLLCGELFVIFMLIIFIERERHEVL